MNLSGFPAGLPRSQLIRYSSYATDITLLPNSRSATREDTKTSQRIMRQLVCSFPRIVFNSKKTLATWLPGTKDTDFIAALETTVLVNFPRMDGVPGETTQSSLNYCTSRLTSSPDAFKGKRVGGRPRRAFTLQVLSRACFLKLKYTK